MHSMRVVLQKLDDGENEILGFVKGIENFVFGDRDRCCARGTALYFEKAESTGSDVAAFDVIA